MKIWLHKRRIDLEGAKMSKSLGNVLTIPSIVDKNYSPLDLRYYLLSVHYRTNLKFSWKGMDDAKKARAKIVEWMRELKRVHREDAMAGAASEGPIQAMKKFAEAMDQDLNTPGALGEIFTLMNHYHAHVPHDRDTHMAYIDFAEKIRHTFGCFEYEDDESIPAEVQALLDERAAARIAKNFAESDRLRQVIEQLGYDLKDGKDGQTIHRT